MLETTVHIIGIGLILVGIITTIIIAYFNQGK